MKKTLSQELLILGFLACLIAITFWEIVSLKEVFWYGDVGLHLPWKVNYARELKRLNLLLWTPNIHAGFPIYAEGENGSLYPLNLLLFFLLPPTIAYSYSILIHFFLAGSFTYIYLRLVSLGKISSLIGALVFMFGGFLIGHIQHFNRFTVAVWLPLLFICAELYFRNFKLHYTILGGAVLACQLLGGDPQTTIYAILALALYFFFQVSRETRIMLRLSLGLGLMVFSGIGLAAIQLIPTYELTQISVRAGGMDLLSAQQNSFPPQNLLTFIFPYFFTPSNPLLNYLGYHERVVFEEVYGYVGILPLALSLATVIGRKNRFTIFFSMLLLLSLLLALGKYNPFYGLLYRLPLFNYFRNPARFLYLTTFSWAILAAFGLELISIAGQKLKQIVWKVTAIGSISLIGGFLLIESFRWLKKGSIPTHPGKDISLLSPQIYLPLLILGIAIIILRLELKGLVRNRLFRTLVVIAVVLDLFLSVRQYLRYANTTAEATIASQIPETVKFLKEDKELYRIYTYLVPGVVQRNIIPELLIPNHNMLYQLPALSAHVIALKTQRFADFMSLISPKKMPLFTKHVLQTDNETYLASNKLKLLSLLNVKYLLCNERIDGKNIRLVWYNKAVKIYQNLGVLPRVFFVPQAKVIATEQKILQELTRDDFDPQVWAILEEEVPGLSLSPQEYVKAYIKIRHYSSEKVIISAFAGRSGLLILSDLYYPGWKAFVDGHKEKIYRVDYILRGVFLNTPGKHKIEFIYDPSSFKIGLYISLSVMLGLSLGLLWLIYAKKSFPPHKHSRQETL